MLVAPFWHLFSGIDLLDAFWSSFGSPLAPFGSPLAPFGSLLVPFGSLLAPFWHPLGPFWRPLAPFGSLFAIFGYILVSFGFPFRTLGLNFHVFLLIFLIFKFHRIFPVAFYKNYVKSIGNEMVSQFNVFLTICFFSCHVFLHPISKKTRTRPKAPPSKTSFRSHRDLPWTRSGNLPQAT